MHLSLRNFSISENARHLDKHHSLSLIALIDLIISCSFREFNITNKISDIARSLSIALGSDINSKLRIKEASA